MVTTLKSAQQDGNLEAFIKEQEPLVTEKESLQRYIDASAIPLDNRKEGQSKSKPDFSADCK